MKSRKNRLPINGTRFALQRDRGPDRRQQKLVPCHRKDLRAGGGLAAPRRPIACAIGDQAPQDCELSQAGLHSNDHDRRNDSTRIGRRSSSWSRFGISTPIQSTVGTVECTLIFPMKLLVQERSLVHWDDVRAPRSGRGAGHAFRCAELADHRTPRPGTAAPGCGLPSGGRPACSRSCIRRDGWQTSSPPRFRTPSRARQFGTFTRLPLDNVEHPLHFCSRDDGSVGFGPGCVQRVHVHVLAGRPLGPGDVSEPGAREAQAGLAVRDRRRPRGCAAGSRA